MKHRILACLLAALMTASMFGCTSQETESSAQSEESSSISSEASENNAPSQSSGESSSEASTVLATNASAITAVSDLSFDADDTNTAEDGAQQITLNGDSIDFSGSGASVDGSVIKITEAGTYIISGTLNDGQIMVEEDNKGIVHLIFNGVNISSSNSAAVYIKNSGKTIITLKDGTENVLNDAAEYTDIDTEENEPSACLFSKDDLSVNGNGSLTVTANYNDGITCKDDLKIVSGTITVTSKDDGIIGRDMLAVKDGTIKITAGGDGMKATNDTSENSGNICLLGGSFDIEITADGIQAVTSLNISDGTYKIVSGGGHENAAAHSESFFGKAQPETTADTDSSTDESSSCKALKCSGLVSISGGSFDIDSCDDSIHSNSTINISGGEYTMISGDDGVHADTQLVIDDCNMTVSNCYEGIESADIIINGGTINVTATDDGFNAAGGADSSNGNGMFGGDVFSSSTGTLTINGGTIFVSAAGDGLDSNGSIVMTGGYVIVDGPTSDGDGALDYDGTFEISGGTFIAGGSAGMAQTPTDGSTEYSIFVGTSQSAGTEIKLLDSSGTEILSYTPTKQVSCVLFSSADIKNGESYTVTANGEEVGSCTVSSYCTTIGNITASNGGSMGGMGGKGGNMRGPFQGQTPPDDQNGTMTPPDTTDGTVPQDDNSAV